MGSSVEIWKAVSGALTDRASRPAALTIGAFDGVHRGHQALLERTREAAGDGPVLAITFDPHPAALFAAAPPLLLTDVRRRVDLLREAGADMVRVLAFSRAMADWEPAEFVDRVILEQCRASAVVVGANFRFGHRAAGTTQVLAELGADRGFEAVEVALLADHSTISSTRIRAAIADGNVELAAELLGRPHEVAGTVVRGDQRGRELGYPTANVPVPAGFAVPPDGVYAGRLVVQAESMLAAVSVGTNPTFEGVRERRVESYVLDREGLDLYGRQVRVEFLARLRPMVAFDSVEALRVQMQCDVDDTRRFA